jgi:hypothetical protein
VGTAVGSAVRAAVVGAGRAGRPAVGRALRAGHVVVERHGISDQVGAGPPDGGSPSLLTSPILVRHVPGHHPVTRGFGVVSRQGIEHVFDTGRRIA